MKISAIRIEVTPWTMGYTGAFDLRIKLQTTDGKEYDQSKIIERNDLESFFDRTWMIIGETIKAHWKKEDENQK